MPFDHERFKNICGGVQSVVVSLGLVVGGLWTAGTFVGLAQAQKAVAEAEKTRVEAELARRSLANAVVVNASIAASQLPDRNGTKWVVLEVSASNTGNLPIKLETGKNMRLYVSRVEAVDQDGAVTYGPRLPCAFDYADKIIDWFVLRPGAELEKLHAVQTLPGPGLYLARFAIQVPDDSVGEGREYSADTYFVVD